MPDFVLVVDDDSECCDALAELLAHKGYVVRSAVNGVEALAIIHEFGAPRIILLDLMMPVMNGVQLRAELLKDPALAAIPIVLCSGLDALDAYASVLDCDAFVAKPLDPSKLTATVGKLAPITH